MSVADAMSDDDWEAEYTREQAEEEADRLRKAEPAPPMSREDFLAWRAPRATQTQAVRLDNPLWHWLVRTRWSAYRANDMHAGPSSFNAGPMWCFERFGKSETPLPDGRVVDIGGEHEDHYDPDFCIYNDVVVIGADGEIAIHGYPLDAFPPTDFHSATLVDGAIIIIGRLGYPDQRIPGTTPVYRLALDSMHIARMDTQGEAPGWIYRHSASLLDDGRSIVVRGGECFIGNERAARENIDTWSLDALTGQWQRLTRHDWQRWTIRRRDLRRIRLWDVRQAAWHRDHPHLGLKSYWRHDDEPDLDALARLYRLDEDSPEPTEDEGHDIYAIVVDGLKVRFKEESFWVEAIVEGRLSPARLQALQQHTLALMERLEASACEIENMSDNCS